MEQSSLLEMAMYLLVIRHAAAMDKEVLSMKVV
jgi:hypothetical protein